MLLMVLATRIRVLCVRGLAGQGARRAPLGGLIRARALAVKRLWTLGMEASFIVAAIDAALGNRLFSSACSLLGPAACC